MFRNLLIPLRSVRFINTNVVRCCKESKETPKVEESAKVEENSNDELKEIYNKYLRALAETENVRRRGIKQVEEAKSFAIQSFCKDLVGVADLLGLALDSVDKTKLDTSPDLKNLYEGVLSTNDVLLKTLSKHGLVVVSDCEGQKFDPNLHEAVFQIARDQTSYEPGHIAQVLKSGCYLHGRVVRPVKVAVVET